MSKFVKFAQALAQDEGGVVTMEWAVAASIVAVAGIVTFIAIGENVSDILGVVNTQLNDLAGGVTP